MLCASHTVRMRLFCLCLCIVIVTLIHLNVPRMRTLLTPRTIHDAVRQVPHGNSQETRRNLQLKALLTPETVQVATVQDSHEQSMETPEDLGTDPVTTKPLVHLAMAVCGSRLQEALVMLKSAALLSKTSLKFHIVSEKGLQSIFHKEINKWPPSFRRKIEYRVLDISFPPVRNGMPAWQRLFKACAAQRLFLPGLLSDVDAVVYVDTDLLFLSPLEDIWEFFSKFNSTQTVAAVPNHSPWYSGHSVPFYGKTGINTGVMLMNLTRLRASTWDSDVEEVYGKYHDRLRLGDQDILNIYFHFKPELVYVLSCEWNYRTDHCVAGSKPCEPAMQSDVRVLHGNREVWRSGTAPAFNAVYTAFAEFDWSVRGISDLQQSIHTRINSVRKTSCGKNPGIFTAYLHPTADKFNKTVS